MTFPQKPEADASTLEALVAENATLKSENAFLGETQKQTAQLVTILKEKVDHFERLTNELVARIAELDAFLNENPTVTSALQAELDQNKVLLKNLKAENAKLQVQLAELPKLETQLAQKTLELEDLSAKKAELEAQVDDKTLQEALEAAKSVAKEDPKAGPVARPARVEERAAKKEALAAQLGDIKTKVALINSENELQTFFTSKICGLSEVNRTYLTNSLASLCCVAKIDVSRTYVLLFLTQLTEERRRLTNALARRQDTFCTELLHKALRQCNETWETAQKRTREPTPIAKIFPPFK